VPDSAVLKQWLKNLQTEEKGVLTTGKLSLRQILLQVRCGAVL
jgi:hypothetical protein